MTIKTGDALPDETLMQMTADGPAPVKVSALFPAGRRVVLFAVPGAFTPTCSAKHLPGFIEHADAILAKGVDAIVCMSVNDVFVMDAWGKAANTGGKVAMVADGNGTFAKALGLEFDGARYGMGTRSQRFALVAKDGKVEQLFMEEPGAFKVSSAEHVLAHL